MTRTPVVSPFRPGPGRPRKTEAFRQHNEETTRINIDLPTSTNRLIKLASAMYECSRADIIIKSVAETVNPANGRYFSESHKPTTNGTRRQKPKKR